MKDKTYLYDVTVIDGSLKDKPKLEQLKEELNYQGEEGYRLSAAIPQVYEGSTEATILIFEAEKEE